MDSCSVMLESVQGEGPIDAGANNLIRDELQRIQEQLVIDRAIKGTAVAANGVDSPVHFDFDAFVTEVFTDVLSREAQRNPKSPQLCRYTNNSGSSRRDKTLGTHSVQRPPFAQALASFLRLQC